nr:calmodulin-binding transcription activator 2-like [Ziziphus jujuba var. spinosa]XP_048318161.1 calmodulin-binding transcription activator 2-like [Ziziphus jujuba var. spinosa]XP_048318162.1 calmodulin-binding transcription activator 2-like [Ziziphus jujuba var. spinosa]
MVLRKILEQPAVRTVSERTAILLNYFDMPDTLSLKDSLTAVPIATQATDRIFLMFRMQPFEKRQLSDLGIDEFGLSDEHALSLPAAKTSKAGPSYGQVHAAAVHIQKKYRGWKKRKEFLIIRQRIFKIEVVESKFFLFFKILQRSYFNIKDKIWN